MTPPPPPRFQIWKMTSGAGGQGWFQGNGCLQWAPSLGGHFPSPQRPTSQLPSVASCYQSRRAHLSFLTYLCHLSSYSLEGKLTLKKQLVRNFGLASPGRCSLKQTPQRPLSSPPASKQKLARGGKACITARRSLSPLSTRASGF